MPRTLAKAGDEAENIEILATVDGRKLWLWHYKQVSNNRRYLLGSV